MPRSAGPTPILLAIKGLGHGGAERLLVDTVATGDHRAFEFEVAFVLSGSDARPANCGTAAPGSTTSGPSGASTSDG